MWSADSAIDVPLEQSAHLGAGSLNQYPLVLRGDVEHVTALLRAAATDIAHRDHRALRVWEVLDPALRHLEGLPPKRPLLGERAPVTGETVPVACQGLPRPSEAIRVDSRL